MKAQQSAMKLTELGPRLTLEIFKVEQGVNEGDVLYHKFVHKTPAEAAKIKAKVGNNTILIFMRCNYYIPQHSQPPLTVFEFLPICCRLRRARS